MASGGSEVEEEKEGGSNHREVLREALRRRQKRLRYMDFTSDTDDEVEVEKDTNKPR